MELRTREKDDRQENIPSAKNSTKEATFRKLANVCPTVRRKRDLENWA
jgi:hypothetical protein